jgi:hypothetical protein
MLEVFQGAVDLSAAAGIRGLQIRDHHADVGQFVLANRHQQVGQGRGADYGEVGVADGPGTGILKVGRQLIQQDQQGAALEEVDPGRLPWC